MALNMSDPAAAMTVYSSILNYQYNWLLLRYVNDSFDELALQAHGSQGIEELKTKISDLNEVFIAFYREEVDANPGYVIINYIPPSVSGVRRARALVHSRRVGAIFKSHQAILTVDSLSLITSNNVHQAITNPEYTAFSSPSLIPNSPATGRSHIPFSEQQEDSIDISANPSSNTPSHFQPLRSATIPTPKVSPQDMVRRSFTATYAPHVKPPSPPPVPPLPAVPKGGGSRFTNLLRWKRKADDTSDSINHDLPPPTPPKDKSMAYIQPSPMALSYSQPTPMMEHDRGVRRQRSHSMSDFAIISHGLDMDDLVVVEPEMEPLPPPKDVYNYTLSSKSKWSAETAFSKDPVERARRRRELQLQREKEEREALEEEVRRQEGIKQQKEAMMRAEVEDEKRRRAEAEEEIRHITAERRRRERMEKEEDERKRQELEERKRLDRDRRLMEHRRLEQWRAEQAQKAQIAARQAEDTRRQEEAERQRKLRQAEAKVKQAKDESGSTGWITVLGKDSLSWKRRFFKFVGNSIFLYRDSNDLTNPLERVNLKGNLRALKEWNEGYEDLEAIAFSFVVEFKNDQQYWSMYADSDAEKYKLLGLFKVAGGL